MMLCIGETAAAVVGLTLVLIAGTASDLAADLAGTELLYSYVVFRHGDRTPETFELAMYPNGPKSLSYSPYGHGQLTNVGKQRAYGVGEYLRTRYDGFLARDYLPSQLTVASTDMDRTKMSALAALAALFPPTRLQRWHPELPWQPIPYSVQKVPNDGASRCYSYYQQQFEDLLAHPDVQAEFAARSDLFKMLAENSGANITTPFSVLLLQGAVHGNQNYGIAAPAWHKELMPQIEEIVELSFKQFFYNDGLIRAYAGSLLHGFLTTAASVVAGTKGFPRVQILSTHDTTVAALLSAARVFTPHQPQYGAAFSLDLRRNHTDGVYYVAPVYKVGGDAGEQPGAARVLRVPGCGDSALCPLDAFVQLTENVLLTPADELALCLR